MRVAVIGAFGLSPKGTMKARALPLAQAAATQGHTVKILMPPWHTPDEAPRQWEEDGVALEYVSMGPHVPLLAGLLITLRLVRGALDWRPDVICFFKPKGYAGLAAWCLWQMRRLGRTGVRLVLDEDDWEGPGGWNDLEPYPWPLPFFFAWQERWGLRHSDAVTVASRTLETLAWSLGVPSNQVCFLPNGTAARGAGDGDQVRARYGWTDAPVLLLYTRFFEYDVARVVDVLARVAKECPSVRLLVVGEGLFRWEDARFDALVVEAGLEDRAVRAGWVPAEDLPDYFAAADVALFPYDDNLINRAKCSVKLLDLLVAGVPVVAEAVGENREYILHNETGVLVPCGDTEAMAAALLRLLRDKVARRDLGASASAHTRSHYNWEYLAKRWLTRSLEPPEDEDEIRMETRRTR